MELREYLASAAAGWWDAEAGPACVPRHERRKRATSPLAMPANSLIRGGKRIGRSFASKRRARKRRLRGVTAAACALELIQRSLIHTTCGAGQRRYRRES